MKPNFIIRDTEACVKEVGKGTNVPGEDNSCGIAGSGIGRGTGKDCICGIGLISFGEVPVEKRDML